MFGGLQAIEKDLPRAGRTAVTDVAKIVRLTTQTQPDGATQWSTRTLAAVAGVSDITIQRICVYNTPCFNLLSVFCMKTVKPKSQLFGQEQPFLAGNQWIPSQ